jgi:hypothetical protein
MEGQFMERFYEDVLCELPLYCCISVSFNFVVLGKSNCVEMHESVSLSTNAYRFVIFAPPA